MTIGKAALRTTELLQNVTLSTFVTVGKIRKTGLAWLNTIYLKTALIKNDEKPNSSRGVSVESEFVNKQMAEEDQKREEDLNFFLSNNINQENILGGKRKRYGVRKLKP